MLLVAALLALVALSQSVSVHPNTRYGGLGSRLWEQRYPGGTEDLIDEELETEGLMTGVGSKLTPLENFRTQYGTNIPSCQSEIPSSIPLHHLRNFKNLQQFHNQPIEREIPIQFENELEEEEEEIEQGQFFPQKSFIGNVEPSFDYEMPTVLQNLPVYKLGNNWLIYFPQQEECDEEVEQLPMSNVKVPRSRSRSNINF
jgi:hypothetical protein